jgi:hypothetical protein
MDDLAILPAPSATEPYVELARTQQGKLFRKHILSLGTLIHPQTGDRLKLDEQWYDQLKANFEAKVCPIVQVPLADEKNRHTEAPDRNVGEVIGLERQGPKIYALMDIRDDDAAGKVGKTLLGSSAFLHMNYTDTKTGQKVGPTLLHNCITNRPYVTDLDDYEPVLAASNVISDEPAILVLTEQPAPAPDSGSRADITGDVTDPAEEEPEVPLTKEELVAQLKTHGIDVEALQAAAAQPPAPQPDNAALSAAVVDALKQAGVVQLSAADGTVTQDDLKNAIVELAQTAKAQGEEIGELKLAAAEAKVDAYIDAGRLLPKSREKAVRLELSGDGFEEFLAPEKEPFVKLNSSEGTAGDEGQRSQEVDIDAEVAKLTAQHKEFFERGNGK